MERSGILSLTLTLGFSLFGISKNRFSFRKKRNGVLGLASAHTGGCSQHVAVNKVKVKVKVKGRAKFFAFAQNGKTLPIAVDLRPPIGYNEVQ
ncbi:MAG: hypothetical protein RR198_08760 [Oscillospiraceae bacterium]